MKIARFLSISDLLAACDDPRMLLLDVRLPAERAMLPLDNPVFSFIYEPRTDLQEDAWRLARLVGDRRVIVIDADEARAGAACDVLRRMEVDAQALEGGTAGWLEALSSLFAVARNTASAHRDATEFATPTSR